MRWLSNKKNCSDSDGGSAIDPNFVIGASPLNTHQGLRTRTSLGAWPPDPHHTPYKNRRSAIGWVTGDGLFDPYKQIAWRLDWFIDPTVDKRTVDWTSEILHDQSPSTIEENRTQNSLYFSRFFYALSHCLGVTGRPDCYFTDPWYRVSSFWNGHNENFRANLN